MCFGHAAAVRTLRGSSSARNVVLHCKWCVLRVRRWWTLGRSCADTVARVLRVTFRVLRSPPDSEKPRLRCQCLSLVAATEW